MAKIIRLERADPGRVFVDSGAWIAGLIRSDQHHARAVTLWEQLRREAVRIVTSTFVLDEVLTFTRYREGLPAARRLGESILRSSLVHLVDVDRHCVDRAWELFTADPDAEPSFTDCTSFALIERLRIGRVFTFDDDFRATGAELLR